MLTHQQLRLLQFLETRYAEQSVMPSFEEMAREMDLKSKSGIHRLLSGLEERGAIRRLPNRARAIEIVGPSRPKRDARAVPVAGSSRTVPMLGRIAAGNANLSFETRTRDVSVPEGFLGSGDHFALQVGGDSMVDAGIHDGDVAVIHRQDTANPGDIVVALIDGMESTLKRFLRRGSSIVLKPENPLYESRVLGSDRVAIQGRLVTLLRNYG
jgi:repressor LexA